MDLIAYGKVDGVVYSTVPTREFGEMRLFEEEVQHGIPVSIGMSWMDPTRAKTRRRRRRRSRVFVMIVVVVIIIVVVVKETQDL
jgi:hypothetical protein